MSTPPSPPVRTRTGTRLALVTAATTLAALGLCPPAAAFPVPVSEAELPNLVTTEAIRTHLQNLETIATYNGGNRASGTPGYDVAAKYVTNQLKRAGYKVIHDHYSFEEWVEHSDPGPNPALPRATRLHRR